ncbi:MAG: S8 family serine peptidase, partial [Bacteroidota bacterium]
IRDFVADRLDEHHIDQERVKKVYDLGLAKGALLRLTEAEVVEMAKDSNIASIEPNEIIAMSLNPGAKSRLIPADKGPSTQRTTYNISAVGGSRDFSNQGYVAFIIDSGIDLDHPDLNVVRGMCFSTVPYDKNPDDGFGHGTHVAGIIGAKNNGKGVVGVAAGARLAAIKVLDKNGYGTKDNLLTALTLVQHMAKKDDVINISLGTDQSPSIDNAIINLKNLKRVHIVVAAGNSNRDVLNISPAKIQDRDLYVVGSVNQWENVSSFSNYGNSVEYLAPGEGIYSTYKNGQYAWMNGTSMAAPHLAGILLVSGGQFRTKDRIKIKSGNRARLVSHR